jgi:hypothetical protein
MPYVALSRGNRRLRARRQTRPDLTDRLEHRKVKAANPKGTERTTLEPKSPGILVDIDSTLYDADPIYLKYFASLFGVLARPEDLDEYDFWQGRISREQFLEVITNLHSSAEILGARPYPGAVATLADWRARGARIHVVSDRKPETVRDTLAWLGRHGVGYDGVALESRIDKLVYAKAHDLGVIIDDKPALLEAAVAAGLLTGSIRHAYHGPALLADRRVIIAANWTGLRAGLEPRIFAR